MRRKIFPMLAICLSAFIFSTTASAQQKFSVSLNGAQEAPNPVATSGKGTCVVTLNTAETQITISCSWSNLSSNVTAGHIHDAGPVGVAGPVRFNFNLSGGTSGSFGPLTFSPTPAQVADLRAKRWYVNIHTTNFAGGEIRGQVKPAGTVFDLDGDGRTNITVFRPTAATFFTLSNANNSITANQFGTGTTGDTFLNSMSHDFDGDGRADLLLISLPGGTTANAPAFWSILQSGTNTIRTVQWGNFATANTERLVPADYDGDGKTDIAVFRAATGIWYIIESSTGNTRAEQWGAPNDVPSIGDYDKDGKADLCAIRIEGTQRIWYIRNSSTGQLRAVPFGSSTGDGIFFFAPIDVDGDGAQDIMINRAINNQRVFYILRSSDNQVQVVSWGINTGVTATSDTALFGDYDGDGKTDFVARRTRSGLYDWYILQSSTGQGQVVTFGGTGDTRFPESGRLPESSDEVLELPN